MEDDVDISALAIEQYIALIPDDIKLGIVNPKIGDDVEFEINANFMRELRRKLFACTDDEDTYEHGFSNKTQGKSHEMERQASSRKLEEIRNFKQERDETLYYAWERYNDLLYQCPLHDLNCQQKVHIFYTGLDIPTRKILDSNGFIPLMTPTQALESIQVMADHSHNWYDETTTRERINDVLDNVDAIHESFKGEHLTKECSLKKENEAIKHSRYMESLEETIIKFCEDTIKKQTADDEKIRKILENTESNIRALKTRTKNLQEKAYQLTHKVLTNKENMKESVPHELPPMLFLGHLKEQMGSPYRTRKTLHMIGNHEEIHNEKA
ncbi:reverse transcriptase domain-containing protein, partial [Tanacetum coccineum]